MSFRQVLNKNPIIMVVFVLVIVGVAGWVVWSQTGGQSGPKPAKAGFFSVDDGKTWFIDDLNNLPPFDKDGKKAVRAYIFKCDGKEVCGYLEKYTDRAKTLMEEGRKQPVVPGAPPKPNMELMSMGQGSREVKKPGDASWTNMNAGGLNITRFACPGGGETESVIP